jgi:hypothetical protein
LRPLALLISFSLLSACIPDDTDDDAGPPADAGTGPAEGGDLLDDAGPTDAGVAPCELDPVLGSLELAAGFRVASSAPLADGIVAVAAVAEDASYRLYGVDGATLQVHALGTWPTLGEAEPVFSLAPAGTNLDGLFASSFLATDGTRLAGGYTGAFDLDLFVAAGKVSVFDLSSSETPLQLDAPNNYSAAYADDALVVSAAGLDSLGGADVYAFLAEGPVALASYDPDWFAFSGVTTATSSGGLYLSAFFAAGEDDAMNHVFHLSPAELSAALNGTPIDLGSRDEVGAWPLLGGAAFGDGFAFIQGDFFSPVEGVRVVEGIPGATPVDVLRAVDGCTSLDLLEPFEGGLLVGVRDANGARLLHLRTDG